LASVGSLDIKQWSEQKTESPQIKAKRVCKIITTRT
jgi:hypothetical protein